MNRLALASVCCALLAADAGEKKPSRAFDWAAAVHEFPELSEYAPVPSDAALRAFATSGLYLRVGGKCRALQVAGGLARLDLGSGAAKGHTWRWSLEVQLGKKTTLDGPKVVHGLDRVGDGRVFKPVVAPRQLVPGTPGGDELLLYADAHTLEIACWGTDESTMTCEGKAKVCKRCSVLRLIGAPRGAQRVYGDGVIRADLTRTCEDSCGGPGLLWSDFEALTSAVAHTPVVDSKAEVAAHLFRTAEACAASSWDLAPDFTGAEPAIPPR